MKNLKKSDIIALIMCLCAMIPGAVLYDRLPDRIVTNWNLSSNVTGTTTKPFALFGIPLIFTAITLLCCIYMRWLEKKRNVGKLIPIVVIIFPITLYLAQSVIILYALGKMKDIRLVVCVVISVILIVFGNYMPKIRKNCLVGIRTPHIMANDEIWDRTHRFAGIVLIVCGIIGFITSLIGFFTVSFVILVVSAFIPLIYGEVIYYSSKSKQ
ncbi:MAG: SdpI family protein [Ruminococcus sp.]|uniref:SdpI family protein n=1 Tax=Ruminococcus sp. TaxID=41978 RepID=UPI0025CEAA5B|nr:SdpI family protein [Ruminococcus sp.]MCR4794663.1 SdpI family protein [Ruminococcus sp.]